MPQRAILLNVKDDVATAIVDLPAQEAVRVTLDDRAIELTLNEDIEFGHKFALRDIAQGEPILKYGLPIGNALSDIRAGDWVHVHNCRSEHFGFHREQYGLKA
jgi:altronate dehydratase small subunit